MQYHLDTIPVWEAMEWKRECPLCGLKRKTEQEEVERTLGASVMEPSVRVVVNQRGICRDHHRLLFTEQNRLGHALLMDSHSQLQLEVLLKLQNNFNPSRKPRLFAKTSPLDAAAETLTEMTAHCVVCDNIEIHMARYRYTFLHLWKTNPDFRVAWQDSKGVCLPHVVQLLQTARSHLNQAQQADFAASAFAKLTEQLTADKKDLDWFTRKFDYRNQTQPWGESKTALERVVNRLRGWCLGEEPYPRNK